MRDDFSERRRLIAKDAFENGTPLGKRCIKCITGYLVNGCCLHCGAVETDVIEDVGKDVAKSSISA